MVPNERNEPTDQKTVYHLIHIDHPERSVDVLWSVYILWHTWRLDIFSWFADCSALLRWIYVYHRLGGIGGCKKYWAVTLGNTLFKKMLYVHKSEKWKSASDNSYCSLRNPDHSRYFYLVFTNQVNHHTTYSGSRCQVCFLWKWFIISVGTIILIRNH